MSAVHKCQARIYSGGYGSHGCVHNAKVEQNGRWYCGTHDPARLDKKRAETHARWDAERKLRNANVAAAQARDAADKRDARRYRWLREQVKTQPTMVFAQALFWNNGSRTEFDKAVDAQMAANAPTASEATPTAPVRHEGGTA